MCPVSNATLQTNVGVGTIGTPLGAGATVATIVGGGNGVNVGKTLTRGGDDVGLGIGWGMGSGAQAPNPQRTKSPTTNCQTVKENVLPFVRGEYVFYNCSDAPL